MLARSSTATPSIGLDNRALLHSSAGSHAAMVERQGVVRTSLASLSFYQPSKMHVLGSPVTSEDAIHKEGMIPMIEYVSGRQVLI